jgi:elongation factor Ts
MTISASMVRELRDKSGAPMMDCKKALEATGGNLEDAFDHLRKAGLKAADKKSSREMGDGRVAALIADDGRSGSLVAVTCETDFVANTPDFQELMTGLAEHVLEHAPTGVDSGDEPLLSQKWAPTDTSVEEGVKVLVGKLGENIQVSDAARLENAGGYVFAYVHHDNKQAAMVSVTTGADRAKAEAALKSLCQHLVVFMPPHLDRDEVPADVVEREKAIYLEEVKGKPENIQDKIVGGKLEKFFSTVALVDQPWIHDDKQTVAKALEQELGAGTRVAGFARFRVGE